MSSSHANTASRWTNVGELLRQLTVREVAETIKGSALGILWLVFNPILSMCLYLVVFGVLFGGSFGQVENESSISYAIGIYIGLSMVNLVNETIAKSTNNLLRNRNLIKKVVFPLEILPIVQVLGTAFKVAINACLWIIMGLFFGSVLSWEILYMPVIFLPMMGLALGLSAMISALSVYFRDLQQLTNVMSQIVFWSSGVFYSSIKVMEFPQIWTFLKWNPVLLATENLRAIVLWGIAPDLVQIAYLYGFSALFLVGGFFLFARLKSGFPDFL
ncbi:ABC transporter permease [Puniceicoccales bacterium CK1056]|uniref:Transport permease protein n=1 Tax=Oceanipulchritudo coccoides TaxID=2706888 RepID=A0A6B2M1Z5_9BACT|nr:ABC transporter permease [Oceanipulchritudo coccoides]NDV62229.1 ABC transporter permease [Oceanipulchritudo coccoides]